MTSLKTAAKETMFSLEASIFMGCNALSLDLVSHFRHQISKIRELGNGLLHVADEKRGKTRARESRLVLVLLLIG